MAGTKYLTDSRYSTSLDLSFPIYRLKDMISEGLFPPYPPMLKDGVDKEAQQV